MSLENTITLATTTRPTDSIIDHKLELVQNRAIKEEMLASNLKQYTNYYGGTFDTHKSDIVYVTADSGTIVPANTPKVLEFNNSPYNMVLNRDSDTHNNTFLKVGTSSLSAVSSAYPRVVVFENRQLENTTNVNSGTLVVTAMYKTQVVV